MTEEFVASRYAAGAEVAPRNAYPEWGDAVPLVALFGKPSLPFR
ncbi:hypothetical protein [Hymenobacter sp. BT730]|nr:hypothetical protein [Hymenobacter sp. BT730]